MLPLGPTTEGKLAGLEKPEAEEECESSKQAGGSEKPTDHVLLLVLFCLSSANETCFFLPGAIACQYCPESHEKRPGLEPCTSRPTLATFSI